MKYAILVVAMKNTSLHQAKKVKNDEFYTQYADIEREMNAYLEFNHDVFRDKVVLLPCDDPEWSNFTKYFAQNFERFGIKKLISTSYAANSKPRDIPYQPTLFEVSSPEFDEKKTYSHGKIFTLLRDMNKDKKIDIEDLEWNYLKGDGDFRSEEVTRLRDEADIIITNPPFSLFREFLPWLMEDDKLFAIIANKNCVTYKEVFPLIKNNKVWSGREEWAGGMWFKTTDNATNYDKVIEGEKYKNVPSIWITNIDHGRRHEPLSLMTMEDNIRFSKHKNDPKWLAAYKRYDNYNVIEVPFTDSIPLNYDGIMGVPISFLDKYNPDQFEIIGMAEDNGKGYSGVESKWDNHNPHCIIDGKKKFKRLFIRYKEK